MSIISDRLAAIAPALAEHHDLPQSSVSVGEGFASLMVPSRFWGGFDGTREVIRWAEAFNRGLIISLSSYGNGKVETTVELGGVPVSIPADIATAQAYDLGRLLQRPLSRDISIEITAAELLAVLDGSEVAS